MIAYLGTNDADRIVMTISPPSGSLGIVVASTILALLPGGSGYKFPFVVSAKAAGTYVTAQRNVDVNTMTSGADGKVVGTINRDKSGTIVVTVMQYSPTATLFTAMLLAQEEGLDFVFESNVVDLNSGIKYSGHQCRVKGYSVKTLSSDAANTLEYTILASELTMREIAFTGFT